ncbi:MAG TPA: ATP-binding protein, partial [Candidatus Norongarragalinales archaeon]|nr:ATP-binding protein [Candidatus Norongarragalinales archaeon]
MRFASTRDVPIPKDPLAQVIGQIEAVKIASIAAKQRRNLLLVGPPGIGKSMLAQAISYHLTLPTEEISVIHNPENPERPFVEMKNQQDALREKRLSAQAQGK